MARSIVELGQAVDNRKSAEKSLHMSLVMLSRQEALDIVEVVEVLHGV